MLRQPTLLLFGPDTLRSKLEALQRLLGGADYQTALMLAAKQPSLVGYQAGVLEAKHAALCAASGLAPAKVGGRGGRGGRRRRGGEAGVAGFGGCTAHRVASWRYVNCAQAL